MPAARRTEGAERRAAFWRTPGGRVLGVVSFIVLGLLGTRQLITQSTAALVAFAIFVLAIVGLALSIDPRARAGLIGALGVYFAGLWHTFRGADVARVASGIGVIWVIMVGM